MNKDLGLSDKEFTVVAYDLPGFGKSQQKEKEFKTDPSRDYFELAASVGAKLMAKLGHKTYAVGGWSDGARVAALLAINNQARVDALVLWGFVPVMDKRSAQAIARTRDTKIWDPNVLQLYSSVYGDQEFDELWHHYVDYVVAALEYECQFDVRQELSQIKCPTLLLHGDNDPIVDFKSHVKPLEMQIYDSDIMRFKGVAHNIHQASPSRFNKVISTFVTSVRVV